MGSINYSDVINHPAAAPVASKLRLVEDRWAHDFVAAKRAKGLSWFSIAKMLGRCELDVRAQFDPNFPPNVVAVTVSNVVPINAAAPADDRRGKKGARVDRWRVPGVLAGSIEHQCLKLVDDGFHTCAQLGEQLGKTRKNASNLVHILRAKGLVGGVSAALEITQRGRQQLEALRAR